MSRLRHQDGFTLPELLVGITIAMTISLAAFAMVEVVMKRSGEVAGRVEATQKGRSAMDVVTRDLRSQVCLTSTTPPIVSGTDTSVSFYADLSDGTTGAPPERHDIAYDPAKHTLIAKDYKGTRSGTLISYPATPSRTRLLYANVWQEPVSATVNKPVFQYYAFDTSTPPRPVTKLTTPLSADDMARTVRVEVTFRAAPPNATKATARGSVLMHDEVYVRAADPDDPRDVRALDPDDPNKVPPVCA